MSFIHWKLWKNAENLGIILISLVLIAYFQPNISKNSIHAIVLKFNQVIFFLFIEERNTLVQFVVPIQALWSELDFATVINRKTTEIYFIAVATDILLWR